MFSMTGQATSAWPSALEKTRHHPSGCQNRSMEQRTSSTYGILRPDAARVPLELVSGAPAADVADLVERHWTVRWGLPPGGAFTQEILPHPCVNLVTEAHLVAVHGVPLSRGRKRLEG